MSWLNLERSCQALSKYEEENAKKLYHMNKIVMQFQSAYKPRSLLI